MQNSEQKYKPQRSSTGPAITTRSAITTNPVFSTHLLIYSCLCLLLFLSAMNAEAQELRAGLEYQGQITKNLFIEPGVESRYYRPYTIKPNHLLFSLSTCYKFGDHWKLKAGFRYRTGAEQREEILSGLEDKKRFTLDAKYSTANKKNTGKFQLRLRYQLSQEQDDLDNYYRIRLKWNHTGNKGFTPFVSTELIFSEFELDPHSCRLRAGIDIQTTSVTDLCIFYQAEVSLEENHDITHYVIGCRLYLHAR